MCINIYYYMNILKSEKERKRENYNKIIEERRKERKKKRLKRDI